MNFHVQEIIEDDVASHIETHKFPFITDGENLGKEGLSRILCPMCRDEYTHPTFETHSINSREGYSAVPFLRGAVIAIPMWCESGHNFITCIGHHKGNTYIWCAPSALEMYPEEPDISVEEKP